MTKSSASSLALAAVFAAVPIFAIFVRRSRKRKGCCENTDSYEEFKSRSYERREFPAEMKETLEKCNLAYLATIDTESNSPHLSLMRYTYIPEDGVIVMSTQRHTKKFAKLQKQRNVAMLVHDFPQFAGPGESDNGQKGMFSITLNGRCYILDEGEDDLDRYRMAHLRANPRYPQFIIGKDIALLCVEVQKARFCDIHDRVTKWSADGVVNPNDE